jgi:hypothetical protein
VRRATLHGLRDTHALFCAKTGASLEVVSRRLGYASIGITAEKYSDVFFNRDADAAGAVGRLVGYARRSVARCCTTVRPMKNGLGCCTEPKVSQKNLMKYDFLVAPAGFEFCEAVLADPVRY